MKTEEDAPMVTVLVAKDTVYKQMVAIPLEKKGNRDPFASRSLAAFARHVGHPKVIIQGDPEHALMAVSHDACVLLTAATPRTSPVNSKGSNEAAERAVHSVEGMARTPRRDLLCDVRDLLGPQFSKKSQSSERGGELNSIWPTKSKMERKMLHQVGHPPQDASDIAKQIVRLAGHSASPHSTALVLNVSPPTAWFLPYVDLIAILLASCSEQENQFFFELAQNTPMAQTWRTQVDILTHISQTWAQVAGASLSAL